MNMKLLKKKTVEVTPEGKLQEASIIVEQQVDQFRKMEQEVSEAQKLRAEAVIETEKEIASLEAQLQRKKAMVENARAQNQADQGFIERIRQFIG
jgi:molecular chaperone GrpE (heat shock protein)